MSDKQQSYTLILPEGDSKVMVYPSLPEKLSLNDTPKEGLSETNFKKLWSLHPEEYGTVKMYGNEIATPRWQQTFGQDYYFSGMTHKAVPLEDDFLKTLLAFVNKHSLKYGLREESEGRSLLEYKQVLVNWYEDGNHYIGKHSDNESQLVPNSAIYSFSFGQERDFVITSKKSRRDTPSSESQRDTALQYRKVITMPTNSLLVMCGEMQKYYKHEVPKRALSKCPDPRINVTMRLFE